MKKIIKQVSVLGVMIMLSGCIVHDSHRGGGYHDRGHHDRGLHRGHSHGKGWGHR